MKSLADAIGEMIPKAKTGPGVILNEELDSFAADLMHPRMPATVVEYMGREMNKMTDGELAYLKRAIKKLEEQK